MGWITHHAIIVTSWDAVALDKAARQAKEIGLRVLGPSDTVMNSYSTMLVCPDGSKEGWDMSDDFNDLRAGFMEYLRAQAYEDGSSSLEWVLVAYGNDDGDAEIEAHGWDTITEANDD